MDTITVQLKKRHFDGTTYICPDKCPLAKALREKFDTDKADVRAFTATVNRKTYYITGGYSFTKFVDDLFDSCMPETKDDTVIRELTLEQL